MKVKLVALALLALLAGCLHAPPLTTADGAAIQAVAGAWRAAELPALGDCATSIEVRRWRSKQAYVDQCTGPLADVYRAAAEHSAGCTDSESRGILGRDTYILELAPGFEADEGLVQHEALHAFVACSGLGPPEDPYDTGHADRRLWEAVGGASSVQGRALRR